LFAQEEDVLLKALFANQVFGGATVRAVAYENQLGGHFGANDGEDLDDIGYPFDGAEIGEVHEDGLGVGGPLGALGVVGWAGVDVGILEVVEHVDGAHDAEPQAFALR
jgi:hypothetical protein